MKKINGWCAIPKNGPVYEGNFHSLDIHKSKKSLLRGFCDILGRMHSEELNRYYIRKVEIKLLKDKSDM